MAELAVIVPMYNVEKCITDLLQALAAQEEISLEVWLVDDGSQDGTGAICQAWVQAHPEFNYVRQDNRGVSAARNRGLELSRGDYVAFMDADDWVEPDAFTAILRLMKQEQAEIGFMGTVKEEVLQPLGLQPAGKVVRAEGASILQYDFGAIRQRSNPVFKRALVQNLRFDKNIKSSEDLLFYLTALAKAQKAVFDPAPRYHYLVNPESAMHRVHGRDFFQSELEAQQQIYQLIKQSRLTPAEQKPYYLDLCRAVLGLLRYAAKADDESVFTAVREQYRGAIKYFLQEAPLDTGHKLKYYTYLLPFSLVKLIHGGRQQNVRKAK
jgi:glycosyltransferase involved in cell wall biosynthesis